MLEYNGVTYPDQMPKQVMMMPGPHCPTHGWTPGATYPVVPTYQEEHYRMGGHYVQVKSVIWKHGEPLAPGLYLPK